MKVVDIRNVFEKRRIQLFYVDDDFIYYAEEKLQGELSNLYILEYNRDTRRERLVTNYTLEDSSFVQHIFAFEETILLVLENGSSSLWVVELDRRSGMELSRRKLNFTGRFYECKAIDANNIIFTAAPDEKSKNFFKQYKALTKCDTLAYIYDIEQDKKSFIRCPLISKVGCDSLFTVKTTEGNKLIILDPWGDEETKLYYFREQRWISADIRDNIWICDLDAALLELKDGKENLTVHCVASADIKGMVRYAAITDKKLYMKATHFKSGVEKICSYDFEDRKIEALAELLPCEDNETYYVENRTGQTYRLTIDENKTLVESMMNDFKFEYKTSFGKFIACIENRFIITNSDNKAVYIIDTKSGTENKYDCKCEIYGSTLVLY
ncbi:hypothetical protein [Candidatus Pseudoruminococcus sp.]|uniref:hypothetical protein n=1 Tax=Candidatus Pseudoruminococcus sp. TaxID=3101048 RepID=UPI00399AB421